MMFSSQNPSKASLDRSHAQRLHRRALRLSIFALTFAFVLGAAMPASALSCWRVTEWDGQPSDTHDPSLGDMATLEYTDCSVVPEGWGWVEVTHSLEDPGPTDLFLMVPNSGPQIWGWLGEAWRFDGQLVYMGVDGLGIPEILFYEPIINDGNLYAEVLYPWPPKQAGKSQFLGKRVRLRHARTNHCLYTIGPNNGQTKAKPCHEVSEQTFVVDHVGNGKVRLRHEDDNQCLYTQDFDNGTVHHWFCSGSFTQRFKLPQTSLFDGGFRLHNIERGQCVYGNDTNDPIRSWNCWESGNQTFKIDRLE